MVGKGQEVVGLRGHVLILCLYWIRGIRASDTVTGTVKKLVYVTKNSENVEF